MQNYRYFLSSMPAHPQNLNLSRRAAPGLLLRLLAPVLKPLLRPLRRKGGQDAPVALFAAYMVGDFFMALPALKKGARAGAVVVCRPDCAEFLAREGIRAIPFDNAFRLRPGLASFLRTARAAWALRGRLGDVALDLDADPRTAFWLKAAGVRRVVSYRRAFGILFDETFPLPEPSIHQADRDMRVVEEWLKKVGGREPGVGSERKAQKLPEAPSYLPTPDPQSPTLSPPWILSVWTRKAAKNWPLERWEALIGKLKDEGVSFVVLDAPDGDARFREFRRRWSGRADFLRGSLPEIADAVQAGAGVIATDNFLGHMAGYYGKPVLWINQCSPTEQVEPRGPRTVAAQRPSVEEAWRAFGALRRGP
jgi:ADP-heptose:LPS heptosyltransferase